MTLAPAPLLTTGAQHSAQTFRMMIRDLARGSEGVTEGGDLKVSPLPVPAGAVRIGDGSAVIRGRASPWQGHYTAYNIGAQDLTISPTGGTPRTDLIVLRVQDPEYEGNRNPATDPIVFFDVISNVPPTTVSPPAGYTAIALARVSLPESTGTVTAGMITDLRRIANPRRERTLSTAFPSSLDQLTYSDGKWHTWPASARWSLTIPPWAVNLKVVTTVAGLRMSRANVYASMQQVMGMVRGQDTVIDDDQGSGVRRSTVVLADSIYIPAALRGTTQTLYLGTFMSKAETGDLSVDGATSIVMDAEFTEGIG
ncbi:hypothetical protein ACFWXK_14190 [Streptomyces sp. NPDC059070]|uniref:hypothetical protein n=1 Tax=Streptomyces sp. NPDC059070 TaxID=3346713 RepID=UPI0036C242EF